MNTVENLKKTTPRTLEIVAIFSLFNGICRAKIIALNDDDSSKCILIDIGSFELVKSKHIFALPSYASINKVSKQVLKF